MCSIWNNQLKKFCGLQKLDEDLKIIPIWQLEEVFELISQLDQDVATLLFIMLCTKLSKLLVNLDTTQFGKKTKLVPILEWEFG